MDKIKLILFLVLCSTLNYSQIIKTDIFTVNYSEEYQQPIWLEYTIQCPNGHAERTGITKMLQDLKNAGLKMRDLKTEQNNLEKIFVTLVKENNED